MIEMGGSWYLGTWWRGAFGTFMISRPTFLCHDWLEFSIWNGVTGSDQSCFNMLMSSVAHSGLWRLRVAHGGSW